MFLWNVHRRARAEEKGDVRSSERVGDCKGRLLSEIDVEARAVGERYKSSQCVPYVRNWTYYYGALPRQRIRKARCQEEIVLHYENA